MKKAKEYQILCVKIEENTVECLKFGTGKKNMVILPGLSVKSVMFSAKAIVSAYSVFKKDYTVYVLDRAKLIKIGYDIYAMAQDAIEAIKELGLNEFYLFGVSQGGAIAQVIALKYPEMVKKLVLVSTFSRLTDKIETTLREWVKLAERGDQTALNRKIFREIYSEKTLKDNALLLALLSREGNAEDCKRFTRLAAATFGFDVSDKLGDISCPTLVVGSKDDGVIPQSELISLADVIGAERFIYDGYGHAVYDEAPDFKERIADFFGRDI